MTKYYLTLEQEAQQADGNIDRVMEELVRKQQEDGFGFCEYWQQGYELEVFCDQYLDSLMQRTSQRERQELECLINKERTWQSNLMVEKTNVFHGRIRLGAYKILWRPFRRIGFPGTKLKGHPDAVNDGCFLCIQNTSDKQKGVRIPGPDDSTNHVVLMNPFPILTDQVTIASLRHEPQELTERHIEFVLHLTERTEKFKYTFNGIGAGASIPHFHLYGFTGSLPIEQIPVETTVIELDNLAVRELDGVWPIITLVVTGDRDAIASYVLDLASHLSQQDISVNILFTRDENLRLKIYVIPRRKPKPERQTGFNKDFGVIEMSGVLVCKSSEEFKTADTDRVVEAMRQVGYPNAESGKARLLHDLLARGFERKKENRTFEMIRM
jgi:hypothetical protein